MPEIETPCRVDWCVALAAPFDRRRKHAQADGCCAVHRVDARIRPQRVPSSAFRDGTTRAEELERTTPLFSSPWEKYPHWAERY